ncbi:MAG: LytTR family transcriptional regulator [Bacteroidales bacterium]|nr:LytTR family transcriptional regulator [Bacteroidales bacterium]
MVIHGESIKIIPIENIAYFFAEGKYAFLVNTKGDRYLVDTTLEKLIEKLNPLEFFRINRLLLLSIIVFMRCIPGLNAGLKLISILLSKKILLLL